MAVSIFLAFLLAIWMTLIGFAMMKSALSNRNVEHRYQNENLETSEDKYYHSEIFKVGIDLCEDWDAFSESQALIQFANYRFVSDDIFLMVTKLNL